MSGPTTRWRDAVMTAFALGGIAVSTWGPRLPQLRADLGVGNAAIGLVLAGVTVGSVAGLTVASALLSWLGPRRGSCLLLGLVGAGIALIGGGAGLAHSVALAASGFLVVGFGVGTVDVMINVEGAAVEGAAGKTLMPLMHAAWSAGAIVGAGIGAGCAALGVALQWQFFGEAVLIAAVGILATRFTGAAVERPPVEAMWLVVALLVVGFAASPVLAPGRLVRRWLTSGATGV